MTTKDPKMQFVVKLGLQDCILQEQSPGTAVGPFAQARDAAGREEEEECADSTWKKWLFESGKKGLLVAPKKIFISIRNESYRAWVNVFLIWSSIEITHEFWCVWSVQYQAPT